MTRRFINSHTRSRRMIPVALAALAAAVVLANASPAVAVDERGQTTTDACGRCHSADPSTCTNCHEYPRDGTGPGSDGLYWFDQPLAAVGPHGGYTTMTNRCEMCHTLHDASTGFKLLPGATVKDTCNTCHDGTGGGGVYGSIAARGGSADPPGHDIDETNVVPGGDATSGGSLTVAFRGGGGNMTCSDCHSPHNSNTIAKFAGERTRIWADGGTQGSGAGIGAIYSNKLLKRRPTGATADVAEYGSDWCIGCHKGRASGGIVHNHPVDSGIGAYTYENVPLNETYDHIPYRSGGVASGVNVKLGTLGLILANPEHSPNPGFSDNPHENWEYEASGWLMKYPRDPLQVGHGPLCQQCHEDSRDVGYLSDDGSQVWMRGDISRGRNADGRQVNVPYANPRFQNFPHETENANLLIETGDNLCLNCHPVGSLP